MHLIRDDILQFSAGIDEKLFTTGIQADGTAEEDDEILGLVISLPDGEAGHIATIVAWYKSTAVNCVQLPLAGDGTIIYDADPQHDAATLAAMQQDRQRLANLALLCLAYIHSPGIETTHVQPDPAVNRKRAAKGKRELPEYYICRVAHARRVGQAGQDETTGRHVSFKFPVRGHFRRLEDGRTIWVRALFRGVEHGEESVKPKVYKVD